MDGFYPFGRGVLRSYPPSSIEFVRAVLKFPPAGERPRPTTAADCGEWPRPVTAALSWSAGARRFAGQRCGGLPIAVSDGRHLHCPAMLEFPMLRCYADFGGRPPGRTRKPITPDLVDDSLFRPSRIACSFPDQGGRGGARALMPPCLQQHPASTHGSSRMASARSAHLVMDKSLGWERRWSTEIRPAGVLP